MLVHDARGQADELVEQHLSLADHVAYRYRHTSEPLEDLVQVARIGLINAARRWDPDRGVAFSTFAVPTILGELRRHFRDHVWTVRLPRGLQELTMSVDSATSQLTEELGRMPTAAELAERLEISVEEVLEAIEASHARRTLSLDAPRRSDTDEPMPAVDGLPASEPGYDRVEAALASEAAGLDEREWEVLRMRFTKDMTQSEIAAELGVSQMQISRISRRALWKLLAAVRGEEATDGPPPSSSRERAAD